MYSTQAFCFLYMFVVCFLGHVLDLRCIMLYGSPLSRCIPCCCRYHRNLLCLFMLLLCIRTNTHVHFVTMCRYVHTVLDVISLFCEPICTLLTVCRCNDHHGMHLVELPSPAALVPRTRTVELHAYFSDSIPLRNPMSV